MIRSKAFLAGLSGSVLFIITTIFGGFLHPGYNHITQFISELYAQGAPGADMLKYAGYTPSGVFIVFFSIYAIKELPKSPLTFGGFLIIGVFYGIGTVLASFFPCDEGCNPQYIDPSLSQLLHNLIGFLTYITVPFALLILGISAVKWGNAEKLSYLSYFCGLLSISFVYLLFSGDSAPYTGLFQRIIELSILAWIVSCSFYLNSRKKQ